MCKYLKAISMYIMQYSSSSNKHSYIHSHTFGLAVSLTKSGIPRILPMYFRKSICSNDKIIIKYILTICNLYRVLPYQGKVKISTITDPFLGQIKTDMIGYIKIFWKILSPKPFVWLWNPFVLSSSGPFTLVVPGRFKTKDKKTGKIKITNVSKGNSTSGFLTALAVLYESNMWKDVKWFFTSCPSTISNVEIFDQLEGLAKSLIKTPWFNYWSGASLGALAFKQEPGKVRVFAMVDCITQWILNPLHNYLFDILKYIWVKYKTDATFDQDAGVKHLQQLMLKSTSGVYSFDLTAATDRLPLIVQKKLLNHLIPSLGDSWGNLLVNRTYKVPPCKETREHVVTYNCGQPMGALSSWAMLAITHHFLVQFSAYRAFGKKVWFKEYMVLGDDLVICNSQVAKHYLVIMEELKVGINLSKSLVSLHRKVAEFAKRLIDPTFDLSPWSLKEFTSLYSNWAILLQSVRKRDIALVPYLRFIGYGSKAAGHSFRIRWGKEFNIKNIYYMLHRFAVIETKDLFRGFLLLADWVGLSAIRNKRLFMKTLPKMWKYVDKDLLDNNIQRRNRVDFLKPISSIELLGLRRLSKYWLDWFVVFSSPDRSIGITAPKIKVVDPLSLAFMFEKMDYSLYIIFRGSKFYHQLCYGRNEDLDSLLSRDIGSERLYHVNTVDYLKFMWDDPKTWLANPRLDQSCIPKNLNHLFLAQPPEEMKLAYVKDMRSLAKTMSFWYEAYLMKIKIWNGLIQLPKPKPKVVMPRWFRP
uniref:RNA-dependent RNA polymerase n=1 Tax=Plasmopara viticola lesion associated mitovirus 30 TaxID=2719457 RepID=A0A6G9RTC1_9VIRU|nr:RNA-dependent RNA polymerase [Plasmopara viticola lesion associated mitovirus 30]